MEWLIADTHWNHRSILKLDNLPFKTMNEWNEILIENWNKNVKKDDTVYHLGDVFLGPVDKFKPIMERLNGRIALVRGNHDRSHATYRNLGFINSVPNMKLERHGLYLTHDGNKVKTRPEMTVCCGHRHSGEKMFLNSGGRWVVDVGVKNWSFSPVSITEIKELIRQNADKFLY